MTAVRFAAFAVLVTTCALAPTLAAQDAHPVALCRDATVSLTASGDLEITPDLVNAGSHDAEGPVTLAVTPGAFTCADVGPNPVTLTVTDSAGQVASCEAIVTVVDDTPPVGQYTSSLDAPWLHVPVSGVINLTNDTVTGEEWDACGIVSKTLSTYSFNACDYMLMNKEFDSITITVTLVDASGNVTIEPARVFFYYEPLPLTATPKTQVVSYGNRIAPVVVRAREDPCRLVYFSYFGWYEPIALEMVRAESEDWNVVGQMLEPRGTYTLEFGFTTNWDGTEGRDQSTIIVEPETAAILFDSDNLSSIPVSEPDEPASFTLSAHVTEAEALGDTPGDAPGEHSRAGDISLAEVAMTLVPLGPGQPISGACTTRDPVPGIPDPQSPFDYDRLPVTAAFEDVPPGTYFVRADVTGDYYQGSGLDAITVSDGSSEDFITGGGHFTWPGTSTGDYPGDRTYFSMKAGVPRAKADKGHLRITRRLADGGVVELETHAVDGPVVTAGMSGGVPVAYATFSGRARLQNATASGAAGAPTGAGAGGATTAEEVPFAVYVEDGGKQAPDRIWIATGNSAISMADFSDSQLTPMDPVLVTRGNIVVHGEHGRPHAETETIRLAPRVLAPVLFQNAPNPFSRITRIAFQIAEAAHTRLSVFDVRGREVARLVDRPLIAGWHEVDLAADAFPAGVYFYRIHAGPFTETRRMILLR